jgi:hypothetical protein
MREGRSVTFTGGWWRCPGGDAVGRQRSREVGSRLTTTAVRLTMVSLRKRIVAACSG